MTVRTGGRLAKVFPGWKGLSRAKGIHSASSDVDLSFQGEVTPLAAEAIAAESEWKSILEPDRSGTQWRV